MTSERSKYIWYVNTIHKHIFLKARYCIIASLNVSLLNLYVQFIQSAHLDYEEGLVCEVSIRRNNTGLFQVYIYYIIILNLRNPIQDKSLSRAPLNMKPDFPYSHGIR